jgi:predicted ATPase
MDLKYVWIKKYKNLVDVEFNFNHSGKEYFQYENQKIFIKELKDSIPENFYPENISGITAVVGENGSGKTNLSEFLNYNLAHVTSHGLSRHMLGEGIIVLDDLLFVQEEVEIVNEVELTDKGFKVLRYEYNPLDKGQGEIRWSQMEKNKYIYYSPNSNFKMLELRSSSDNIINISTNYLMNNDIYNTLKYNIGYRDYDREKKTDLLYAYYRNEKLRESNLILNFNEINRWLKQLPDEMRLVIDHESDNQLFNLTPYPHKDRTENEELIKTNLSRLSELEKSYNGHWDLDTFKKEGKENSSYSLYSVPEMQKKERFKVLFYIQFFRIYINIYKTSFSLNFFDEFIFEKEYKLENPSLKAQLNRLKSAVKELYEIVDWSEYNQEIQNVDWSSWDKFDKDRFSLFSNIHFNIKSNKNKEIVKDIIAITKDLLKNQLHFYYEFAHNLSSGEQNLLNFYSRFHWAKEEIMFLEKDNYNPIERVVIYIDEGEVSLHPEWQRNYFKKATDYLSQIFHDREIQIILITHSPFVLSDIPKDNVIFMKKNSKTGNAEIADLDREKTFGANIYSLLSDSFFMENGTIGEFAKEKIEWVIETLDNKDIVLTKEVIIKVDYIINAIGEPLIKMQLESMLEQRLNLSEVSVMRKRIEDLENQISKQNDKDQKK